MHTGVAFILAGIPDILLIVLILALIVAPVIAWNMAKRRFARPLPEAPQAETPLTQMSDAERLQELERLRTAFYTNITHEFRTPLTVISGMAALIDENPEQSKEAVQMIRRNSQGLLTLVNQMLDLSKLDSGAMKLNMIKGDVTSFLNYIVESLSVFADQEGISLTCQHDMSPYIMDYDPEKLMQIVSNLVSNGIKFTPESGSVEVWTHETNVGGVEQFHISVRDTGIGIGTEHLQYIFSRFYRVEDTAIKVSKGTGVGLALTKDLVELMGGQIDVRSATGKGATFIVTLPVTRDAVEEEYALKADDVRAASAAYVDGDSPTPTSAESVIVDPEIPLVLIVEDNPDVATYISRCLKPHYRIDHAPDGEAGIAKAVEIVPDIVISDVMMPKKDGFEVCDSLKSDERTSHIPIILLTARADMDSKIEGLQKGADAYMSKPFEKEELLIRIKNLLDLRILLQGRYTSGDVIAKDSDEMVVEDAFILRLNEMIDKHIDDADYSGDLLARDMTLSRSQLHNKIKALTGRSTALYVRYVRLIKARKLLKNQDFNISEVAYDVGFKDPAYFTRCFKDEFKMSPSEYRENNLR